jgi:hypothetical protein
MKNKLWLQLVNSESEDGTWDFFHYSTSSTINLVKFEGDEIVHEIWMDYQEFEDLSKLILRLNGE